MKRSQKSSFQDYSSGIAEAMIERLTTRLPRVVREAQQAPDEKTR